MSPEPAAATGSYAPGDGVAIATLDAWLLVDTSSNDSLVTAMWSRLQEGGDPGERIEAVIEELSTTDQTFALVTGLRAVPTLVLGGNAGAEVELTGSSESFRCPPALRRADHRFRRRPSSIRLFRQAGSGVATTLLPLSVGIASASQLLLTLVADDVAEGPDPAAHAGAASSATRASSPTPPEPPEPSAAEDTPGAGDVEEPAVPLPEPVATSELLASNPRGQSPQRVDAIVEVGDVEGGLGYGFLFGNTVNRSVADAAVHSADDEQGTPLPPPAVSPSQLRGADTLLEVPEEAEQVGAAPPPSAASPRLPGMIESVPWSVAEGPSAAPDARSPAPAPAPAAAPPAADLDRDELELTMSRQAADALVRQIAADSDQVTPGPTVHAVHCASGHPNPPHADVCRVCGAPVAAQAPVTVPRPVLGYLRFSTGDVIPLDRNVLIGRQPGGDRLVDGMRPHVVKLPSPERDISRNHLAIHLDDWHVLVTDLNSTNGTILTRPGCPPERLRPDQAMMIEPGTQVSLADDASFSFEAK